MKFFKPSSKKDDKHKIRLTDGSLLNNGEVPPSSDKEKRMQQIEACIKMIKSKMGRIFSPISKENLESSHFNQKYKDALSTRN